jgi:murein DD-endopeptidase MepM/ murein hydrolase activator NlpD
MVESLEDRTTPADLQITGLQLLDGNQNPITSPVLGGMFLAQANWTTTGVSASDSYVIRFAVDGVPLDSSIITGQTGNNSDFWVLGGWYASPGTHTLTATVDPGNTVAETSEANNTTSLPFTTGGATGLPAKFIWPMAGVQGKDWSVVNYNDVDPRVGSNIDFNGGLFQYDGHDAFDIALPNFARMDAGVPEVAAAAGTVTEVVDDEFDRDTGGPNPPPGNHIAIDHGGGWETIYYHIGKFTALVKPGDTVAAGQPIALVGSSGNSTDAHLHFAVYHNGLPVETMYAPATYFVDPPVYEANLPSSVTDAGVTNSDPLADIKERPDEVTVFPTAAAQDVWFWYRENHVSATDNYLIKWYRPDGTLNTTLPYAPGATYPYEIGRWFLSAATVDAHPGVWHVALELNGAELVRKAFTVTAGAGAPELHLEQGTDDIISGRTTPIDFGSVAAGGTAKQLAFAVSNPGTAPLTLSGLQLPPGYSLVGAFPASVPAGGSATFTLQLDAANPGTKFGAVRLSSNDSDEGSFWFNVTGTVTGTPLIGTPVLTDSGSPATLFRVGFPAAPVAPGLSMTDLNSPTLSGAVVTVGFASPAYPTDALGVRDQGIGAGQIGLTGTTVTYGGAAIGSVSGGGSGTPLLVTLTADATDAAVRALLRNVTFQTASTATAPRYLSVQFTDTTGLVSAAVSRTIAPMTTADVVSIAPVTPNPTSNPVTSIDVTFGGDLDPATFTAADLSLTRNGGANLITSGVTITPVGGGVYRVGNLAGLTGTTGTYTFTVNTVNVRTVAGIPGSTSASTTWTNSPNFAPTITSANAVTFAAGSSGTFTVTATGFPAPVFSEAGPLPNGVTLTAAGVLSGTPTEGGTFPVTITAANGVLPNATQAFTLTVTAAPIFTSPDRLGVTAGVGGNLQLTATGFPAPTFGHTGTLPTGVALDAAGTLTVAPTTANGQYILTLTATNGVAPDATQTFTLTVGAPPAITSGASATFAVGSAGSFPVTATGFPAAALSEAGGLPNGVTFVDNGDGTATLSGTPAAGTGGTYTLTVTAGNTVLPDAVQPFTLTVNERPAITSGASATFAVGSAGSFPVTATGFPAPTFAVTAGTLPGGVTLDPITGLLAGTPTESGTFTPTITAANGVLPNATQTFTLTVNALPVVVAPASLPAAQAGAAYGQTITASGPPGPFSFAVTAGALPPGLTLSPDGTLSGTPTADGTFNFTVTATAPGPLTGSQGYSIAVAADIPPTIAPIPDQTVQENGTSGAIDLTVSDAQTAADGLTLEVSSSNPALFPPQGLMLGGSGGSRTVTVTPAAGQVGSATITVTVTDGGGLSASATFTATVVLPPPAPLVRRTIAVGGMPTGAVALYAAGAGGAFNPVRAATVNPFGNTQSAVRTASADVDGDGTPDTVFVTGPGDPAQVAVVSGADDATVLVPRTPVFDGFTGGAFVAAGDFDKDGRAEIVVTPDRGGGPRVTIFSLLPAGLTQRANYFTLNPDFRGGARAAVGDVNGDGTPDLAVAAGFGGGPQVTLINGTKAMTTNGFRAADHLTGDFFAFDQALRNGAYVAIGDVDGDGFGDLVFGAGPGGAPRLLTVSGKRLLVQGAVVAIGAPLSNFFVAGNTADRGGVRVAVTDADGDNKADVVVGSGEGSASRARVYLGKDFGGAEPARFQDLDPFAGAILADGVFVG